MRRLTVFLLVLLPLPAQDLAITNVDTEPIVGEALQSATILVRDGVIVQIGVGVSVPEGVAVLDGAGATAFPGMIDGATTLGLSEVGSVRGTIDTQELGKWNAHLRAGIAVNPHSAHIPVARINGITTGVIVPSGGTLPGQAEVLDLIGRTVPLMRVRSDPIRVLSIPTPQPRTYTAKEAKDWDEKLEKSWKPLEEHLDQARRLGELIAAGSQSAGRNLPGQQRLSMLATARHLATGARWMVKADSREHILACLRFAEKHGLKLILAGLREAWKVTDRLQGTSHGLLVGSPFRRPGRDEPYDASYANAAALHRAGLSFGFMSDSSSNVRNLPYQAAMCCAFGLPRQVALESLTIGTARALGIDDTHGSLEKGKVANIVLYDGDPLDARTSPKVLVIRGRQVPLISRHTYLAEPFLTR